MKPTKKPKSAEPEKPPYKPTLAEKKAADAFIAAKEKRGPRLSIAIDGVAARIKPEHPDEAIGVLAIMQSIGTTDLEFFDGLMLQLVNASAIKGGGSPEKAVNFMLSVVKGIEPRDQIEAMLAAQMAAVHMASMTFARRLALVDNLPQQDSAERAFNKLARTFAAQTSALKDYRSKGEQKMTVQHVHVSEGGQAIVGTVNAPAVGGGAREKTGEQPHALGYAPSLAMPCAIEAERDEMPSASGSGV